MQTIAIGQQEKLSLDLDTSDIDYILSQHAKYGLVAANEISRHHSFCGICYSIDKPIPAQQLEDWMRHNMGELQKVGVELRKQAAVANNNMIEQALEEQGAPGRLRNYETTIEEVEPQGPDPAVAEAYRVLRAEGEETPRSAGRVRTRKQR